MRRISPYLTRVLVRAGLSANAVTGLMILSGAASGFALLVPGLWGPLLAVLLTQLQMLWDASDGEVARWRGTSSPLGIFLDKVGHYLTESLIPLASACARPGGSTARGGRASAGPRSARAGRGDRAEQGTQRHGARGAGHGRAAQVTDDEATTAPRLRVWPGCAGSPGSCRSTGSTTRSSSA